MAPVARLALAAAVAAALPLLGGCGALGKVGAGSHNPPASQFTVSAPVSTVVIDGGSGSVTVTGTAQRAVAVTQKASYTSKAPAAAHVLRGTVLTLSYTCPTQISCAVSYDVKVPRDVAVTVSATAGSITLNSLGGPLTARTTAGLITADDLRCAVASFGANAGGVVATFSAVPRSLTASTNVGPITLTVPGSASYQVAAHTVVGTTTVTVHRGGTAHVISARSDLGSISVDPG